MLSDIEKELILACAQKYGVTELYVFGSTLESNQVATSAGASPKNYYRIVGYSHVFAQHLQAELVAFAEAAC